MDKKLLKKQLEAAHSMVVEAQKMRTKDAVKLVKDGGDLLSLFVEKAEEDVPEITPAEEALAAGHAQRIGTALQHIGRGRDVLQVLIAEAARGRRPSQQPLIQDHDQVTPAGANAPSRGPAAEQAGPFPAGSQELKVYGTVVIDRYKASDFFEAEAAHLENLKAAIIDKARDGFVSRKEMPALTAKVHEAKATAYSERGIMLRSEVQEVIVAPVMEFARKLISQRLMVTKTNSNGHKGGDFHV